VSIDEVEACLDSHSAVQASAVACIESPTGIPLAGKSCIPDLALQRKPTDRLVILRNSCSRCTEVCPSTTARRVNLQHVDGHTISGRGCAVHKRQHHKTCHWRITGRQLYASTELCAACSSKPHLPATLELMQRCSERLISAAMPSRMLIAAELSHLPHVQFILMTDVVQVAVCMHL